MFITFKGFFIIINLTAITQENTIVLLQHFNIIKFDK